MKQVGYITEIKDNIATVRVNRGSACGGNCVSCKGCPAEAVMVKCKTEGKLSVGDCVELSQTNLGFFRNVYFGYIQSTVLMVAGAVAGYAVFKQDSASIIGAAAGLAIGLILARLVFSGKGNITDITARVHQTDSE